MRKIFRLTFILILISFCNICRSQSPAYILRAMNFTVQYPNVLDFDIYIEVPDSAVPFMFIAGQYSFNIDTSFFNGGKISYSFAPAGTGDSSDLPAELRPRDAIIDRDVKGNIYLRMMSLPVLGSKGYKIINKESPGTKIIRMRLSTSADSFSDLPLNLTWRNEPDDIFTKMFIHDETISKEITQPENHLIIKSE